MNAIFTYVAIALLLIGGWGLGHIVGGAAGGDMDPVTASSPSPPRWARSSLLVVYLLAEPGAAVLPPQAPPGRSSTPVKHLVLPVLGMP